MFNRDDFMTVDEAAADFGISANAVRRWMTKGYIPKKYIEVHGGRYFIAKEGLELWREALKGSVPMKGRKLPVWDRFLNAYQHHESKQ